MTAAGEGFYIYDRVLSPSGNPSQTMPRHGGEYVVVGLIRRLMATTCSISPPPLHSWSSDDQSQHASPTPGDGHHTEETGHKTPPTPSEHQREGPQRERSEAGKVLVGVEGLCPARVPLEFRQACACSFLFPFFRRSGGKEVREPCYDGYSCVGKDICRTHRYSEQLS